MVILKTIVSRMAYSKPNTSCTDAPLVTVEWYACSTKCMSSPANIISNDTIRTWKRCERTGLRSMKSTRSSASQWKHFKKRSNMKSATNFGLKSSLNMVKARQVSVTAYHDRSTRCSNSAARNWPKNTFRINFPASITIINACT